MKEAYFPAPHSFTYPAFIECLLCARPSDRCLGCQEVDMVSGLLDLTRQWGRGGWDGASYPGGTESF